MAESECTCTGKGDNLRCVRRNGFVADFEGKKIASHTSACTVNNVSSPVWHVRRSPSVLGGSQIAHVIYQVRRQDSTSVLQPSALDLAGACVVEK
jgi:hypothetical protein